MEEMRIAAIPPAPAVSVRTGLFIGCLLSPRVTQLIANAQDSLAQYIEHPIPSAGWVVELIWLGEAENPGQYTNRLCKPMPQSFVPTVQLTHIGRGKADRSQLWAYVEPTALLAGIREHVFGRLGKMRYQYADRRASRETFLPHIRLAQLYQQTGHIGIADVPAVTSYTFSELVFGQYTTETPDSYTTLGTIPL